MPASVGYYSKRRLRKSLKKGGDLSDDEIKFKKGTNTTFDFIDDRTLGPEEKQFIFNNVLKTTNPITGDTQQFGELKEFFRNPSNKEQVTKFFKKTNPRVRSLKQNTDTLLNDVFKTSKEEFKRAARSEPTRNLVPTSVVGEIVRNRPGLDVAIESANDEFIQEKLGFFPNVGTFTPRSFKKGGIMIKPENRGKFTAQAKSAGMGVQAFASKVLEAPEGRFSPTTRKRANFARNFGGRKRKGQDGMDLAEFNPALRQDPLSPITPFESVGFSVGDPNLAGSLPELGQFDVSSGGGSKGFGFSKALSGIGSFATKNADLLTSVGSTISNISAAGQLETEQTPVLARSRRTPFKSALNETIRSNQASYQAYLDSLNVSGGNNLGRSIGIAGVTRANTAASIADVQARSQFNLAGDRLQAGVDLANVGTQNQINAANLGRRNRRLIEQTSARTAGTQDLLNVFAGRQEQNQQSKALTLAALQSGDTGVMERLAESMGMSVEELLRTIGDPSATLN